MTRITRFRRHFTKYNGNSFGENEMPDNKCNGIKSVTAAEAQ